MLLDEAKKMAAKALVLAVCSALVLWLTPAWEKMRAVWQTPEVLAEVLAEMQALRQSVDRATGDDRVLRMTPGMSYVEEPYKIGQDRPLRFNLFAQRTRLGAACRFVGGTSLFTDANGVTLAGSQISPVRNINVTPERIVLDLTPPASMKPGRTVLQLDLAYDCNGIQTFDRTDPVVFYAIGKVE